MATDSFEPITEPVCLKGRVIQGFGRGSKLLGIPTANLCTDGIEREVDQLEAGIYFGWAVVDNGSPEKMVLSVGWNPFFGNTKKTVEPHIIQSIGNIYGHTLRLLICGYIRPESNFPSLEALIDAIQNDINLSSRALDLQTFSSFISDAFLVEPLTEMEITPIPVIIEQRDTLSN